jgi:hypothetical protein
LRIQRGTAKGFQKSAAEEQEGSRDIDYALEGLDVFGGLDVFEGLDTLRGGGGREPGRDDMGGKSKTWRWLASTSRHITPRVSEFKRLVLFSASYTISKHSK